MKKILLSALAACLVSLALVSCGGGGPKDNAEKFLNAFYHMEYDKAGEYATADAKKQLDMLSSFAGMMPDSSKKALQKIKINVTDVKEEGDNATVTYTVTDPSNKAPEAGNQTLKMVKQDGKWLAAWNKQDVMGGMEGGDAGMDSGTDGSMTDPGMTGDTSMMSAPMENTTTPATGDTTAPVQ
jgi:hypothetical protein